ncbi:sugar ABC transporter ATP-binding protein [Haloarchaeobius sp. DYHT-AS-18]|uniref:sugar ABC transporter ATP-binding protein n=1 Tax=Haloarchaeobius sp. DYHT-AS-18 TaxID=3446117 RepID=UPI003EBCD98B
MANNTTQHVAPDDETSAQRQSESSLRVHDISKSFRHVTALDGVSLHIDKGEVVGLVGENGAGKSTLLNILTGVLQPDDGDLTIDGQPVTLSNPSEAAEYGVSLVHQEQDVIPNLKGYENLFLARESSQFGILRRSEMREQAQAFVDDLGIDIDVDEYVKDYSFNERQMLEIAKAFHRSSKSDNPVILLDEPTAGLEEAGRELLFERIDDLRDKATFVFVSHELDEVLQVTDRVYVLKDGELVHEVPSAKATQDLLQEKMVGRESSSEYYKIPDQRDESSLGEPTMEIEDLRSDQEDIGPLSFSVSEGEIFGIVGVEGSGKERLGRLLAGDLPASDGTIRIEGEPVETGSVAEMVEAGVGYVPKDRKTEGLLLYQSVVNNTSLAAVRTMNGRLPLLDLDSEVEMTDEAIEELNIKTPGREALVHGLSGGNQQKVVLARWLAQESSVLVVDNVTRGVDVGAKEEVYRLCRELTEKGVSIVFIGDELPEVIGMSNRIAVMRKGRLDEDIFDASPGNKPTEEELIQRMI